MQIRVLNGNNLHQKKMKPEPPKINNQKPPKEPKVEMLEAAIGSGTSVAFDNAKEEPQEKKKQQEKKKPQEKEKTQEKEKPQEKEEPQEKKKPQEKKE